MSFTRAGAAAALGALAAGTPGAGPGHPVVYAEEPELSPAKCQIVVVDNPHDSVSTPGVVKVNAKTQCAARVPELTLSVTIIDADAKRAIVKTIVKVTGKPYIQNQGTFVRCKDRTPHRFQGLALGTSYEGGKLYDQVREGNVAQVYCGY